MNDLDDLLKRLEQANTQLIGTAASHRAVVEAILLIRLLKNEPNLVAERWRTRYEQAESEVGALKGQLELAKMEIARLKWEVE